MVPEVLEDKENAIKVTVDSRKKMRTAIEAAREWKPDEDLPWLRRKSIESINEILAVKNPFHSGNSEKAVSLMEQLMKSISVDPVLHKVEIVDNKVQMSSEKGHGIGLKNVEMVVEKYDGNIAFDCDEKKFKAVVIL